MKERPDVNLNVFTKSGQHYTLKVPDQPEQKITITGTVPPEPPPPPEDPSDN